MPASFDVQFERHFVIDLWLLSVFHTEWYNYFLEQSISQQISMISQIRNMESYFYGPCYIYKGVKHRVNFASTVKVRAKN